MKFFPSRIPDVVVVEPEVLGDHRGFFMETWRADKFFEGGIEAEFVQDNHSLSGPNILRGLHYQVVKPQGKLIRVIEGEVFDVAVDLRRSSPTFGKWMGEILSAENKKILWVPPGFAHGFYVTGRGCQFLYKCTEFHAPEFERSIRWDDHELAIEWPLAKGKEPILSVRDEAGGDFRNAEFFP